MAPELALHGIASKASDVHSFGILLWELCTLQVAFHQFSKQQFVQDVVKGGLRPSVQTIPSKSLGTLIKECWHANSNCRPSFTNIVETLMSEVAISLSSLPEQQQQQQQPKSPWSNASYSTSTSTSTVQAVLGHWGNNIFSKVTNSVHTSATYQSSSSDDSVSMSSSTTVGSEEKSTLQSTYW